MGAAFCPHCMNTLESSAQVCPVCGKSTDTVNDVRCLPIGMVLKSRKESYIVGSALGVGGFGITYVAKELGTQTVVAIKEYYPLMCNPSRKGTEVVPSTNLEAFRHSLNGFEGEATMLQGFSDLKTIVHVVDFFKANGTAYMVMEFVNGITLREYVRDHGAMDFERELLPKIRQLMEDLNYLHESEVVHRDIAPDNIMIQPDGSLKLIDFGCARATSVEKMTVMVKKGFAPTEQYMSIGQGPYTDVYAFCATIYYCITGGKVSADSMERANSSSNGQPDPLVPPSRYGARISPENEAVLLHGMALMPNARIQTMAALSAGFRDVSIRPSPTPGFITGGTTTTRGGVAVKDPQTVVDADPAVPQVPQPNPGKNDSFKVIIFALLAVIIVLVIVVAALAIGSNSLEHTLTCLQSFVSAAAKAPANILRLR